MTATCYGKESALMGERKYVVCYSKLWKLLIDRKIKKTELKAWAKISPGTYAKLNRDQFVSMDVIARICSVLECKVEDILEFFPEETTFSK